VKNHSPYFYPIW